MRKFEKISFEQFKKDIKDDKELYDSYHLPKRSTKGSAGYDFESLFDFTIKPGENKLIPTGIKVQMNEGEVLLLVDRSSQGFKYNVRMCNQVGVIDKDYYNSESNEGHMFIKIQNEGKEVLKINKGDRFAQGIFNKFYLVDDDCADKDRTGGFGSTGKGE